jgi:hypothetical protein
MIVASSTLHSLVPLSATCRKLYDILFPVLMHKATKRYLPGMMTVLHWASKQGYIRVVKGVLGAGATIDALDQRGLSALMYTSESGHLDISEYLLTQGAIWDISSCGETALTKAACFNHPDVLNALFRHGAFLDSWYWWTLLVAASGGYLEVAKILLGNGFDANFQLTIQSPCVPRSHIGQTSVHVAAYGGHPSLIVLLAEYGANLDAVNAHGYTALERFVHLWPYISSEQNRCIYELCGRNRWRARRWKLCRLFQFIFTKCQNILVKARFRCCYLGGCCL